MNDLTQIDQFLQPTSYSQLLLLPSDTLLPLQNPKKEYGRWNIFESQQYLQVLKRCSNNRDVIRELKHCLSHRVESQIRAHHQKMLKKYGTLQKIIEVAGRTENQKLLQVNKKLTACLINIRRVTSKIPSTINQPSSLS